MQKRRRDFAFSRMERRFGALAYVLALLLVVLSLLMIDRPHHGENHDFRLSSTLAAGPRA